MLDQTDPHPDEAEDAPAVRAPAGIGIIDLTSETCRWPLWAAAEPAGAGKRYCGSGVVPVTRRDGKHSFGPYCACHARIAGGQSRVDIGRVVLRATRTESIPAPKQVEDRAIPADAPQPRVRDPLPPLPLASRPKAPPPEDIAAVLARYAVLTRQFRSGRLPQTADAGPSSISGMAATCVVMDDVAEVVVAPPSAGAKATAVKPAAARSLWAFPGDDLPMSPAPAPDPDMPEPRVMLRDIIAHVCAHYSVRRLDLLSQRRTARVVRPRQIAMWLARALTPLSLPAIGRQMGGRDHTTVMHAALKYDALRERNPDIAAELDGLVAALEGEARR